MTPSVRNLNNRDVAQMRILISEQFATAGADMFSRANRVAVLSLSSSERVPAFRTSATGVVEVNGNTFNLSFHFRPDGTCAITDVVDARFDY
jgi:hypothetical protein